MKRYVVWALLLLTLLALPACGSTGGENPTEVETGGSVLTYASLNPIEGRVKYLINTFNSTHEDIQIEVWDYSDENGPERFLVDLMAGIVPDVMELQQYGEFQATYGDWAVAGRVEVEATLSEQTTYGRDGIWLPYQQLVQKGYLEDLWPYIENDPDYGREGVVEQPLKAAEVNGGLYMLFGEFAVTTLVAPKSVVGERTSWTFDEFMEVFESMPPGSTPLQYNATQSEVFFHLFSTTLSQFVDWNEGRTSFDSEEFRNILEFVNTFPAEFETHHTEYEVIRDIIDRMLGGYQLLHPTSVTMLVDVSNIDQVFQEPVSFTGCPVKKGESGNYFLVRGPKLAMTSSCKNKDAAWNFMRRLIAQRFTMKSMKRAHQFQEMLLPINRRDYDLANRVDMEGLVKELYSFNWKIADISWKDDIQTEPPTENDLRRLEELIDNTTSLYWPDDELANIVWDSIGPYLAGHKSMDDVIRLIENRVKLYVDELR